MDVFGAGYIHFNPTPNTGVQFQGGFTGITGGRPAYNPFPQDSVSVHRFPRPGYDPGMQLMYGVFPPDQGFPQPIPPFPQPFPPFPFPIFPMPIFPNPIMPNPNPGWPPGNQLMYGVFPPNPGINPPGPSPWPPTAQLMYGVFPPNPGSPSPFPGPIAQPMYGVFA